MRITVIGGMTNPVGTSQMTAEALTDLVEQHEWTTGNYEVAYQDFDVIPLYSPDIVDRLSNRMLTATDADTATHDIKEIQNLARVKVLG